MQNRDKLNMILTCVSDKAKSVFEDKLNSVILYGSYARGDFDSESDIDIMINADILPEEINQYTSQLRDQIYQFELEADCVISLCVVSKSVFERFKNIVPFYQNVLKEGEPLVVSEKAEEYLNEINE